MRNKTWYTGNTYTALALKLLIVLFLLAVSRMLIYFFNVSLFSGISADHLLFIIFAGLRFDLFTLLIVNLPFIVLNAIPFGVKYNRTYQLINNVLFYILNALALMVNFIDIIYFRFTLKRTTFDIFDYVDGNSNEIISLIPVFIRDFWFPFLLYVFFILVLVWTCQRIKVDYSRRKQYKLKHYFFDSLSLL